MTQILSIVISIAAFLALYVLLRERARRRTGTTPPVHWGWLAAIAACALVAALAGLVL
ncbi:hypothetical protein [Solirubrobacter pauli]|uniref:hypothetical protein n=1 Tax=Solirubrobacter pauli TaxID=166793 RepID=UPI00147786D1|nr:hypothetical protein [Solirubrobacter pauli]